MTDKEILEELLNELIVFGSTTESFVSNLGYSMFGMNYHILYGYMHLGKKYSKEYAWKYIQDSTTNFQRTQFLISLRLEYLKAGKND